MNIHNRKTSLIALLGVSKWSTSSNAHFSVCLSPRSQGLR